MNTTTATRTQVVEAIDELAAIDNRGPYAEQALRSARAQLAAYDRRPDHWTVEHFRIALRDAENTARLGLRYLND